MAEDGKKDKEEIGQVVWCLLKVQLRGLCMRPCGLGVEDPGGHRDSHRHSGFFRLPRPGVGVGCSRT